MRSSPGSFAATALVLGLGLGLGLAACDDGVPPGESCETSFVRYDNFAEPFFLDWCRSCHSATVPGDMRQDAPVDVNFDTLGDIRDHRRRIYELAGNRSSMPPAGGPSDAEREMLVEWLSCGAR
jgi:uncharacterized membrane protein